MVAIVDCFPVVAESIGDAVRDRSDHDVCGWASNEDDALEMVERCRPDVVLVDYDLDDGNGMHTAQAVKEVHPTANVIMVTGSTRDAAVIDAVRGGCDGLVHKSARIETLLAAIDTVLDGGEAFTASDLGIAVRLMRSAPNDLSKRELQVLRLLGKGLSTAEMADRLSVSSHTVRSHVQKILRKLEAHSKLEAVAIATRMGLVHPDKTDEERRS